MVGRASALRVLGVSVVAASLLRCASFGTADTQVAPGDGAPEAGDGGGSADGAPGDDAPPDAPFDAPDAGTGDADAGGAGCRAGTPTKRVFVTESPNAAPTVAAANAACANE